MGLARVAVPDVARPARTVVARVARGAASCLIASRRRPTAKPSKVRARLLFDAERALLRRLLPGGRRLTPAAHRHRARPLACGRRTHRVRRWLWPGLDAARPRRAGRRRPARL